MKVTSSYAIEIKHIDKLFRDTVCLYRKALSFLIDAYEKEWEYLSVLSNKLQKQTAAENLIHNTKSNKAKYGFDEEFYKFPSYLRRDVRNAALGILYSYHSNLNNWESSGKKGNKPVLQKNHYAMPVFFRGNMYQTAESDTSCKLKIFKDNDWIWVTVNLKKTDVDYLKKYWLHLQPSAPKLEKKHKKWFLRFSYEEDVELSKEPVEGQIVCTVDLGINTDAVCSIMTADGTVAARKFINFAAEKDHLYLALNKIREFQRLHGSQSTKSYWAYATRLNDELSKKIAREIVSFADDHYADVIVFEHLDMKKKNSGPKKQKLHMWRKNGIQKLVAHRAHRLGIRIAHINARNTSKLAFDGSGEVIRDEKNYRLCKLQTGKQYNCDLSASYNIGSRYFIRELLKSVSEKKLSLLWAEVPESEHRTTCTLSTLWKVYDFLHV